MGNLSRLIEGLGLIEEAYFIPPQLLKLKKLSPYNCQLVWTRLNDIKAVSYDLKEFIDRLDFHYDYSVSSDRKSFTFIRGHYPPSKDKPRVHEIKKNGHPPFNDIPNKPPAYKKRDDEDR